MREIANSIGRAQQGKETQSNEKTSSHLLSVLIEIWWKALDVVCFRDVKAKLILATLRIMESDDEGSLA